jgi:hypothetical protein
VELKAYLELKVFKVQSDLKGPLGLLDLKD